MNLIYSIQTAFANLRANKLRSLLTMLGVIIGVGAVIVMVAIVQGASARVTDEFKQLGSSLIIIYYQPDSRDAKATTRKIDGMTMTDIKMMQEQCDGIKDISAEMPVGNEIKARNGGIESVSNPNGVQPAYEKLRKVVMARGRFISEKDMDGWAKVCVIGDTVSNELFKNVDPLGQTVDVNGLSLTVVGVIAKRGRSMEGDQDRALYIPLTTVQKRLLGKELVGVIWAEAKDPAQLIPAMDQVWQFFMRRYDNLPGFHVDSQENILNSINKILSIFGIILGSIAGLALLVGGIGIMNIMLVSVTERTREVGIRKAIGAKRRDILLQFLIESSVLSGTGGLLGILLGAAFAYTVGYVTTFIPGLKSPTGQSGIAIYLPVGFSIGAFLFSASIGIFFGIYPAVRASRLDPITALRHE